MFLTADELREWTDLVRPSAICRWLDQHGYKYEISAKGWPKVMREAVKSRQITQFHPTRPEPQLRLR
jgi:hypothetical protein